MCVPMELMLIPESQMVLQRFFCEIVFKQRVVHSLGLLMEKRIMLQATRWPRLRQQFWGSVEQMQPEYNLHRKIFIDKMVFSIRIQYPDSCIFNTESNLSLKTGLWMAFDSFGTWSTAHYFTSTPVHFFFCASLRLGDRDHPNCTHHKTISPPTRQLYGCFVIL